MPSVVFNKPVKYAGEIRLANTIFKAKEEDVHELLAKGGHLIEEAEPGQLGQAGLGNVNTDDDDQPIIDESPYKGFKNKELKAELDARNIEYKGITKNADLEALLLKDDADKEIAAKAEQEAKEKAEKYEALVLEAKDLDVSVTADDTLETLQAKIDAKKAPDAPGAPVVTQ